MFNFNNGINPRGSFFNSRNGTDQLSLALGLFALILFIIYPAFDQKWVRVMLLILCFATVCFILFRCLSENIESRRKENEAFLSFIGKLKIKDKKQNYAEYEDLGEKNYSFEEKEKKEEVRAKEDRKNYTYFNCPKCKTRIRVPRGKGRINITCPVCKEKFEERS